MRTALLYAVVGLLLLAGNAHAADWTDLPPLGLDECARVTQSVAPDPGSPVPGNYILTTGYAADEGIAAPGSLRPPGLVARMIDTFAAESRSGVTHARTLVVHAGAEDVAGTRHWVVADSDGNGRVDRAQIFELARDEFGRFAVSEASAPVDRLDAIQAYFDEASAALLSRAGQEMPAQCR